MRIFRVVHWTAGYETVSIVAAADEKKAADLIRIGKVQEVTEIDVSYDRIISSEVLEPI